MGGCASGAYSLSRPRRPSVGARVAGIGYGRGMVRTRTGDPLEELAERVSAVMPCETDEDRERLLELLGPLTVAELVALVEVLRRQGAWPG
jgi:hypothetical protein